MYNFHNNSQIWTDRGDVTCGSPGGNCVSCTSSHLTSGHFLVPLGPNTTRRSPPRQPSRLINHSTTSPPSLPSHRCLEMGPSVNFSKSRINSPTPNFEFPNLDTDLTSSLNAFVPLHSNNTTLSFQFCNPTSSSSPSPYPVFIFSHQPQPLAQ